VEPTNFLDFLPKAFFGDVEVAKKTIVTMLHFSVAIVFLFGLFQIARMNRFLLDKNRNWLQYITYFCKYFLFMITYIFIAFSMFFAAQLIEGRSLFDPAKKASNYPSKKSDAQPKGE
jgi:dolichyl-phosphate-mannose--protein O-mannosyl transferase